MSRCAEDMLAIPGGIFTMGSEHHYPEEAPRRRVRVDPFLIDTTPVTNLQFSRFVSDSGYVTQAEEAPDPADYPGMAAELAVPGSLVFRKASGPVDMSDPANWWEYVPGASWRAPRGPGSTVADALDHPVVHVSWRDAEAYARWAGKLLPSEAQWERAAWGGRTDSEFAWGDDLAPDGRMMANYWQGLFPFANLALDGWEGTSPVGSYPPNGYGLYDAIGNVWEWTRDWWSVGSARPGPARSCCAPGKPRGGTRRESMDPAAPLSKFGRKVLKGGSHLCAANYCQRYRPAARHPETVDSATTHIGFRCVRPL